MTQRRPTPSYDELVVNLLLGVFGLIAFGLGCLTLVAIFSPELLAR